MQIQKINNQQTFGASLSRPERFKALSQTLQRGINRACSLKYEQDLKMVKTIWGFNIVNLATKKKSRIFGFSLLGQNSRSISEKVIKHCKQLLPKKPVVKPSYCNMVGSY